MNLRIQSYHRFEDIPLTAEIWNDLVRRNATNSVFQTYEWVESWWSVFGAEHELVFLIAYADERIVGFAALMQSSNQYGRINLRFVSDSNSDYCDFVVCCNPLDFIRAVFEYLAKEHAGWTCIQLRNMPDAALTLAALKSLAGRHGWHVRESRPLPTPYRALSKTTGTPLKWQYSVRRPYNRMQKEGVLRFRHIDDPDDAQAYLNVLIEQHIARYRAKGQASLFDAPHNIAFFRRLTASLQRAGWLDFCVLEFNGVPVALHYGFKYADTLIWYKPSFDIAHADYSPGIVLIKYLIEYAEREGFSTFDFTIGDEAFKDRFCTGHDYNRNVAIFKRHRHAVMNSIREWIALFRQRIRARSI